MTKLQFQSTPSTRRVTGEWIFSEDFAPGISIHTLHTEGDLQREMGRKACNFDFNPHPPHGG